MSPSSPRHVDLRVLCADRLMLAEYIIVANSMRTMLASVTLYTSTPSRLNWGIPGVFPRVASARPTRGDERIPAEALRKWILLRSRRTNLCVGKERPPVAANFSRY